MSAAVESLNVTSFLAAQIRENPRGIALWTPRHGGMTFDEMGRLVTSARAALAREHVSVGDRILVLALPGPSLFVWATAIISLGATALFVEPWLDEDRLTRLVQAGAPRAFLHDSAGLLWGLRHRCIRGIRPWIRARVAPAATPAFEVTEVPALQPAVVTFTSGTTGNPKGVVRTHRFLSETRSILARHTGGEELRGTDLCIFPGVAMLNLAFGRTSLLVSPWRRQGMSFLDGLPPELAPRSLSTGPRFLDRITAECTLPRLQHISAGGAPAACTTIEAALRRFSRARMSWIYGGSEAEPICVTDAADAVKHSREHGLSQVLWVGKPIPEVLVNESPQGLWISGPHVSPEYLASPEENAVYKRVDSGGLLWHCTGDRVLTNPPWSRHGMQAPDGLWYAGRARQPLEEFHAEQMIYAAIGHTEAFVLGNGAGGLDAFGVGIERHRDRIEAAVPNVTSCRDIPRIVYDPRHRARIQREASARKAAR